MINVSIVKDGSVYRVVPNDLVIGNADNHNVETMSFAFPEEFDGLTIRATFNPDRKNYDPVTLVIPSNREIALQASMTVSNGTMVIDAYNDDLHLYSADARYSVVSHAMAGNGSAPTYSESQLDQLVRRAEDFAHSSENSATSSSYYARESASKATLADTFANDAKGYLDELKEGIESGEFKGDKGDKGFSPIANVTQSGDGVVITVTDESGTTTAEVSKGAKGDDGFDPIVNVSKNGSVTTLSVTDAIGTTTAEINDGAKGDAFTYDDFTPEQLAGLKGAKGDKGDKGNAFTYDDFTPEQLAGLKGEKGDKGDKGDRGEKGDSIPYGTIMPFSGNGDIPVGFLLCNGASVGRATYPALYSVIGTTYGSVDDDHFNLPDLRDKFIEGSGTAGTAKEAGLPNITGSNDMWLDAFGGGNATGAFTGSRTVTNYGNAVGSSSSQLLSFDASLSNSIYGNSTTVQPPALTMRYIIKAFAGASADSTDVAITNVANDVADLAGSSEIVASGDGYVRYANGVQMCWNGSASVSANTDITLPQPFINTSYAVIVNPIGSGGDWIMNVKSSGRTSSTFMVVGITRTGTAFSSGSITYVAIGRWK